MLTQITATELQTYDLCPMRRQFRYKDGRFKCGLAAIEPVERMELGLFVHQALNLYTTKGVMPEGGGEAYARDKGLPVAGFEAADRILQAYARKYPLEPKLNVLFSEKTFAFHEIDKQGIGAEMVGRIDLCYQDTDTNIVLRENKYWHPRATIPPLLTLQLTVYAIAVQHLTGAYPSTIEWNILRQPDIRHKRGESDSQFLERVETEAVIERVQIPISPQQILLSWQNQVARKVLLMDGVLPYMNTSSCTWWGRDCEYLPLCKAMLAGTDPEADFAAYKHKEVKHPELK